MVVFGTPQKAISVNVSALLRYRYGPLVQKQMLCTRLLQNPPTIVMSIDWLLPALPFVSQYMCRRIRRSRVLGTRDYSLVSFSVN